MTHWTMPQPTTNRKPKHGDTIESAKVLATLDLGGNGLIVRDSNSFWGYAGNRTFVVEKDGSATPLKDSVPDYQETGPVYPVTVLWSIWDEV